MISVERKQELITKFGHSSADSGSTQVQIALVSERINHLSNHLKQFPKDKHSHRGLLVLVGRKRRLCRYLERQLSPTDYATLLERVASEIRPLDS